MTVHTNQGDKLLNYCMDGAKLAILRSIARQADTRIVKRYGHITVESSK